MMQNTLQIIMQKAAHNINAMHNKCERQKILKSPKSLIERPLGQRMNNEILGKDRGFRPRKTHENNNHPPRREPWQPSSDHAGTYRH